jgi:hypothetical protein
MRPLMLPRLVHAIIVVKKDILPENAQVLLRYFSRYVHMVVKMMVDSRVRALLSPSPVYHLNLPLDLIILHDLIICDHTRSNFFLSLGQI